jgi:hypothetical protein
LSSAESVEQAAGTLCTMPSASQTFYEVGLVKDKVDVEISFQIIGLFSEGL